MTITSEDTFHTHRLSNGLQIVAQHMPDFESVAVSFHVQTGARDEQAPAIAGVSHFLEHMMFKGTNTLDWREITLEFNKIGAELNASTSLERTIYYARVLGEQLERALELLSDMMYPRLNESDFSMEKEVIINEIARSEDQPRGYSYRRMLNNYFGTHPLGHAVLGSRESIRDMHIEQMRAYWHQRYGANNIILSVAGKFEWDSLLTLAEHFCASWRTSDSGRVAEAYTPTQPSKHVLVDQKLKQQMLYLAMPWVDMRDADYYAAALATSVLGAGGGSRLYWNIRHKGLAIACNSSTLAMDNTGLLVIYANTTPDKSLQVLEQIDAELEMLLDTGVREDELQRAKDKWIAGLVLSAESTFSRMYALAGDWTVEGRLVSIDEEIERVKRVTSADVMRVLHRFPLREMQVLTTLGPLEEKDLFPTTL